MRFSARLSSVLIAVLLAPPTVRFAAAIDSTGVLKATIHPAAARAGGEGDLLFSLASPDESWEGKRLRGLLNWPRAGGREPSHPWWWVRKAENGVPDGEPWDAAAFTEFEVRFHPPGCREGVNRFAMTLRGEVHRAPEPPIVRCRIAVAPTRSPGEYVH